MYVNCLIYFIWINSVFGYDYPSEPPKVALTVSERECVKIVTSYPPPRSLRVTGGTLASLGEFPHMVALGYEREDDVGKYDFKCGGSLLSQIFILTTASCGGNGRVLPPTIVRTGVLDISGDQLNPTTDTKIATIIKHPDHRDPKKYHDIALVRLERIVYFNNNVHSACLYIPNDDPKRPLTVTGWGQIAYGGKKSDLLLKANLEVVDLNKCSESYPITRLLDKGITDSQLCAVDPENSRDACLGDSGGPIQALTSDVDGHYRLIGITSFGKGCASGAPGVYTRISSYRYWIEDIVWPPEPQ